MSEFAVSILKRDFQEWCALLSEEEKRVIPLDKAPLNMVNYLWVSKIMNQKSEKEIPTVQEMLDWIVSGQVDAIRK